MFLNSLSGALVGVGGSCEMLCDAVLCCDARGKILHTRNRRSEIQLENIPESPLDNSSENPQSDNPSENATDKGNSIGKCNWKSIGNCQ